MHVCLPVSLFVFELVFVSFVVLVFVFFFFFFSLVNVFTFVLGYMRRVCNVFTVPCHYDVLMPQLLRILPMPINCGLREPAITRAKTASNCAILLRTAFAMAVPNGLTPKN